MHLKPVQYLQSRLYYSDRIDFRYFVDVSLHTVTPSQLGPGSTQPESTRRDIVAVSVIALCHRILKERFIRQLSETVPCPSTGSRIGYYRDLALSTIVEDNHYQNSIIVTNHPLFFIKFHILLGH